MKAISFYNSNINPKVVEYQKKVFDHFGIELVQYKFNAEHSHGFAIDWWLKNCWADIGFENIAIFDIDCIPITDIVITAADHFVEQGFLFGAAQRANHIKGSDIYCSPAFMCLSHKSYELAGWPTMQGTQWHDVGGFLTSEFARSKTAPRLLWPSSVESPQWQLTNDLMFGHGTTYDGVVYHAFESRFNHESTSMFINKCKEVIGE